NKGVGFLQRLGANVVSQAVQLGDRPHLDRVVGPVKVLLDEYIDGQIDQVHIFFTTFINTMKQEARHGYMLPIPEEFRTATGEVRKADAQAGSWDYLYEPDAKELLDSVLRRFVEALVYQMINENMASEQSARMVAMKAATDNASKIIDELQLIYNKSRQASITKELAEIVGGAAAV
ncbi:MAG TPA: F0F1 ATP synthase subunit gamma, partial [Casimicrobiaceae bacterium]|nr:F0F1 ATP synthase subunit gamma [Casimicrobiaceae bacterium]